MKKEGTVIVAVLSTAGVPIVSAPEKKGDIFAMLVYSLVSVTPTKPYSPVIIDVGGKKLYLFVGKKVIFAMLASYIDDLSERIFEVAEDIVYALDKVIVDEGIIDQNVQEKAKAKLLEGMKLIGLNIIELKYLYRKVVGDMYKLVTELTTNGAKFHSYFRIAYFPHLLDKTLIKREDNLRIKRLLELCDGNHSLEYISKALGFTKAQIYRHVAYYIKQRKMVLEMGFELIA